MALLLCKVPACERTAQGIGRSRPQRGGAERGLLQKARFCALVKRAKCALLFGVRGGCLPVMMQASGPRRNFACNMQKTM